MQYVTMATVLPQQLKGLICFKVWSVILQTFEIMENIEQCYLICKFHHKHVKDNQIFCLLEITCSVCTWPLLKGNYLRWCHNLRHDVRDIVH